MTEERLLSLQEVSDRTGLTRDTFYRLRMRGQGPASFLVAHRVRVRESALDEWLAEQEQAEADRIAQIAG